MQMRFFRIPQFLLKYLDIGDNKTVNDLSDQVVCTLPIEQSFIYSENATVGPTTLSWSFDVNKNGFLQSFDTNCLISFTGTAYRSFRMFVSINNNLSYNVIFYLGNLAGPTIPAHVTIRNSTNTVEDNFGGLPLGGIKVQNNDVVKIDLVYSAPFTASIDVLGNLFVRSIMD
jgi:hypothetical protein